MVLYCCVKGCGNNTNNNKKNPSDAVSFHAFPSNSELKLKWLRAIGRPNWDPPNHIRICSVHFSDDQISHDRVRTRIMDNACPVNALPPNSNFEASYIEACRFCLATDIKLYSLEGGMLKTCMESIAGFNETIHIDGLPQFVCYECAAHLIKCYKLVEKSIMAQATLLDIFAQHGKITRCLINSQNRNNLNLTSSLSHNTAPTPLYEFQYDDQQTSLCHFEIYCPENYPSKEENIINNHEDCKAENNSEEFSILEPQSYNKMETIKNEREETSSINNDQIDSGSDAEMSLEEVNFLDDDENKLHKKSEMEEKKMVRKDKNKTQHEIKKRILMCGPKSKEMQDHFEVKNILTLQDQIKEWQRSVETKHPVHRCEVCSKSFVHINSYRIHVAAHDPSRGEAECPVCKLRFKCVSSALSHAHNMHSKKFHCKSCPKIFNTIRVAMKHHLWHRGHQYKCAQCAFSSAHASALYAHARRHAPARGIACARCGRAFNSPKGLVQHQAVAHRGQAVGEASQEFRCEECGLSFESEGARRVHGLSAHHDKKTSSLRPGPLRAASPPLRPPRRRRPCYALPGDRYPKQCDHCEVVVSDRSEHFRHVQRRHKSERASYRPVILAICDTCGKGFQNTAKLRVHELRHGSPSVRCEFCPKVFYDKYRLAGHLVSHSDARPHRCDTCGRGFKLRGNLDRHYRVHTDEATYECTLCAKKFKYSDSLKLHVRSVHQKIPLPPRKKRARTKTTGRVSKQTE